VRNRATGVLCVHNSRSFSTRSVESCEESSQSTLTPPQYFGFSTRSVESCEESGNAPALARGVGVSVLALSSRVRNRFALLPLPPPVVCFSTRSVESCEESAVGAFAYVAYGRFSTRSVESCEESPNQTMRMTADILFQYSLCRVV